MPALAVVVDEKVCLRFEEGKDRDRGQLWLRRTRVDREMEFFRKKADMMVIFILVTSTSNVIL